MRNICTVVLTSMVVIVTNAEGQAPSTFRACFVPQVGAMYLLDLPGLPTDCLSSDHEEISWSEGGLTDGSVGTAALADAAVTSAKIADGSITSADLAPGTIAGVGDGSINTVQLADAAVTAQKLGEGAVTSAHVLDNSLTAADLATGSVRALEIAPGAVGSSEVANNSLTADDLATNSVTSSEISNGSILRRDIAAGAITIERQVVSGGLEAVFSDEVMTADVSCPVGFLATGGAWSMDGTTVYNSLPIVQTSRPVNSTTWRFRMYNAAASTILFTPRVVCIRITP